MGVYEINSVCLPIANADRVSITTHTHRRNAMLLQTTPENDKKKYKDFLASLNSLVIVSSVLSPGGRHPFTTNRYSVFYADVAAVKLEIHSPSPGRILEIVDETVTQTMSLKSAVFEFADRDRVE